MVKLLVKGAGAWGTALAMVLTQAGNEVWLECRNQEVMASIKETKENKRYLPGILLPESLKVIEQAETLYKDIEGIVIATPSQSLRLVLSTLQTTLLSQVPILLACKGIDQQEHYLMSELASYILPNHSFSLLSGPNFAHEIARELPAATTIATPIASLGEWWMQRFRTPYFRPYYSNDIIGAQIGGAVKNVVAIACGITIGKKLGENAQAALITRGLAEMARLSLAKGGKPESLMGLSGIGDMVLTCSSQASRNTSLGILLGQGRTLEAILSERIAVTEGVTTAHSLKGLAQKMMISMPICEAVYHILYEKADIDSTIQQLLGRPLASENYAS